MIVIIKGLFAFGVSVLISFLGYQKKSLSLCGAFLSVVVGFIHALSSFTCLTALFTFFVFGSYVTRLGKKFKVQNEEEYKEGGQRNWIQVFSNGLPSTLACCLYLSEIGVKFYDSHIDFHTKPYSSMALISVFSSLASACGDTFASEMGTIVGKSDPVLITTFQKVPRGTNGGISMFGTLASIFGGFLVGISVFICSLFTCIIDDYSQWPIIVICSLAGFIGSAIDSYLGATLQFSGVNKKSGKVVNQTGPYVHHISGYNILDNHNVNLISNLLTGIIMSYSSFYIWPILQKFNMY